jgi:hypothetical protein
MGTPDVDALQVRLTMMERKFRVMTAAWMVGLVVFSVLWIGAQQVSSQSQVINTHELNIVDQAGKARISLGFGNNGAPAMWFYDAPGATRVYLGFSGSGVSTPQLVLLDEHAANRIYIGWNVSEQPNVVVRDGTGKAVWSAP